MPSKRSLDYWAKRRAREMYEELIPVEEAAEEMRLLYFEASKDVEAEAMKLARKFQLKHNLSEAETHRLLNQLSSAEDLAHLRQLLKANPDNADVAAQLESQAYAARIRRLIELQSSVDAAATAVFEQVADMFPDVLEQIATRTYYEQIFGMQQRAGFGFMFNPLDQDRLQRVLQQRWGGDNFSKKLWEERLEVNTQKLATKVKKEIMLNLLTGKTPHQMATAIQKEFGVGATETRRLIRTEATYVSGQIQLEAYKEMGVEKYIYVAILDLRTSLICRSLDKKRFLVKNAMPGDNYPPMHPWCRSTTIAWMPDELLKRLEQRALDPATGQRVTVPGDMTYEEWEQKFVKGENSPFTILKSQSIINNQRDFSSARNMANGSRMSRDHIITEEEEALIRKEAKALGIPEEMLAFNEGARTGFKDSTYIINIRGDILPDVTSTQARDILSIRAVLAHEYYGHAAFHPSSFEIGDWRDEFRASYFAAINAPNLSANDRRLLMLDAYDRAREANIFLEYSPKAKKIIYGYENN